MGSLERELVEYSHESVTEAISAGIWGWADDLAFTRDWGFALADIIDDLLMLSGDH